MSANTERIYKMLQEGEEIYMVDDFYEVAIRFRAKSKTDLYEIIYLKHKGCREVLVPHGYDTAVQIQLGGEFITRADYDRY